MTTKRAAGKEDRQQTTINLTEEAMEKLDFYVVRRGGRGLKKTILSRLVEWFIDEPDMVKSALIGWVDSGAETFYADALRRRADDVERQGVSLEPGVTLPPKQQSPHGQAPAGAGKAESRPKSK